MALKGTVLPRNSAKQFILSLQLKQSKSLSEIKPIFLSPSVFRCSVPSLSVVPQPRTGKLAAE